MRDKGVCEIPITSAASGLKCSKSLWIWFCGRTDPATVLVTAAVVVAYMCDVIKWKNNLMSVGDACWEKNRTQHVKP